MTHTEEIIHWLKICSKEIPGNCDGCPYNKDPYEIGCGKLLADAALALEVLTGVSTRTGMEGT